MASASRVCHRLALELRVQFSSITAITGVAKIHVGPVGPEDRPPLLSSSCW